MKKRLLGIKASLDPIELDNKMKALGSVPLLEIFLAMEDMNAQLLPRVRAVLKKHPDIKLTLHTPIRRPTGLVNLEDEDAVGVYDQLCQICDEEQRVFGIICHAGHDSKDRIIGHAAELRASHPRCPDYIYVENCVGDLYQDPADFADLVHEMGMKKVCFDFSHFASTHKEKEFYDCIRYMHAEFEVYCHISDNKWESGITRPMNLGQGVIDLKKAMSMVDMGIIEVYSTDELTGKEMIADYKELLRL